MKQPNAKTPSVASILSSIKELTSDLFSQTTLMLEKETVGYLKALRRAIVKKKLWFFCTNVEELIHSAENRLACDHGQGLLKLVVQPTHGLTFLDSVKGSMLVAVSDAQKHHTIWTRYPNLYQK